MRQLLSISLGALCAFASANAAAVEQCSNIHRLAAGGQPTTTVAGPVVYMTGSSAIKPMLAELGKVVFADPVKPITVVYFSQGSCPGVASVVAGTPLTAGATTKASYWDNNSLTVASSTATEKEEACLLDANQLADIGASDVFAQSCGYAQQGLPAGIKDFQGPIQSMTFAVPKGSSQQSISYEAAYLTFGLAALAPWTDPAFQFIRNASSGTQQMIAAAIGVDPTRWLGTDKKSSDGVFGALSSLVVQSDIDKAIGILSSDYSSRTELKQLAYQHQGQTCAYKPDVVGLDKRNTREGRYAIWGPIHFFSQVDASGLAVKKEARDIISYITGTVAPPLGVNLIRLEANIDVVPPCAMKVQRSSEMGPMTPYVPTNRCGCAFDQEAGAKVTCKTCASSGDCKGSESCNFGFCEAN